MISATLATQRYALNRALADDGDTSAAKAVAAGEIEKEDREIEKGIRYSSFSCSSSKGKLAIRALSVSPTAAKAVRLYENPSVHPVDNNPYVGDSLLEWVSKNKMSSVVGATNANFFGVYEKNSYRSIGYLYSQAITPHQNSPFRIYPLKKTDRPLTPSGGEELLVYSERKAHRMVLVPSCPEGSKTCQIKVDPALSPTAPASLTSFQSIDSFTKNLVASFPKAEWMMQLSMPLMDAKRFACGNPDYPTRCRYAPRTLLCVKPDQTMVLATTSSALIEETAEITQPKSACELKCSLAYNLDGGGSTQMAVVSQPDGKLKMVQGGSNPRPVQNLLLIDSNEAPISARSRF